MEPLTKWPDDEAPIREWCRPLSATMVNVREAVGYSGTERAPNRSYGGIAKVMRRMVARKAMRDAHHGR